MRVLAALVLAWTLAGSARADDGDRFEAAIALEGQGKLAEAAVALRAYANTATDDGLAADALAEAAGLYESRLYDPAAALACWKLLVDRHPEGRAAPRARARVAALQREVAGVSDGDIASLGAFTRLLDETPRPPSREARVAVMRFVEANRQLHLACRAHEWLGHAAEESGAFDEAVREYEAARHDGDASTAARALRAEAELQLRRGKLAAATTLYDALDRSTDLVAKLAAEDGRAGLVHARRLRRISEAAIAWLVLFVTLVGWRGRKTLWPPPTEVRFIAPVALLFVVGAISRNRAIVAAVGIISAGSVVLLWLAGAAQNTRRSVLTALASVVAVAALAFVVVRMTDLTQLVVETVTMGPDR